MDYRLLFARKQNVLTWMNYNVTSSQNTTKFICFCSYTDISNCSNC